MRTARCGCKFRYVSKFAVTSCGFSATARLSCIDRHSDCSNAEITLSTLIFTAVMRNHGDSRKSQHTTGKSHDDRYYRRPISTLRPLTVTHNHSPQPPHVTNSQHHKCITQTAWNLDAGIRWYSWNLSSPVRGTPANIGI